MNNAPKKEDFRHPLFVALFFASFRGFFFCFRYYLHSCIEKELPQIPFYRYLRQPLITLFISHLIFNIPDEQFYAADEIVVEEKEEVKDGSKDDESSCKA